MRLFAAIMPPEDAIEDLAEWLAPRREAGRELRWTDDYQWHITLAFMADVPDHAYDELVERMSAAAARHEVGRLALSGGGAFPTPYEARVLWAGVSTLDGDAGLAGLARGIRHAAAAAGSAPEGGRFHPHVTLARTRPIEATKWLRVLEGYAGPPWPAREVALVESHLGEGRGRRPRYEVRERLPLG
ncbi:RNA 2',3'-cyclic phosphodiesterase [Actinomycetota bacterium]